MTKAQAALTSHIDLIGSVVLVLAWSSGFIGARLGTAQAPVVTVLTWRFLLLATGLLAACAISGVRTSWAAIRRQSTLALTNQVLYLGLIFTGVRAGVPPGVVALIASLQPMVVAGVAGPLLGERTNFRQRIGLLIGLAGVGLVVGGDALAGASAPWWAYLCPLIGMLCLSAGTVTDRRWRSPEGLLETQAIQATFTAISLTVIATVSGQLKPPAAPAFWGAVAWLIFFASLAGYGTFVWVGRRQGATRASTLLYLSPPATMLWAYVMFGDVVKVLGMTGLVVTAAGVWLVLGRRAAAGPGDPDREIAHGNGTATRLAASSHRSGQASGKV